MKTIKLTYLGLILLSCCLFYGCTADQGPVTTEVDIGNVSFSADIQPIFNSRCITCHNQFNSTGTGLDLRAGLSHGLLVNVVSTNYAPNVRIVPFSNDNSVLWHKINDTGMFGGVMPASGAPLSGFEIQQIEKWIELGALDD